MYISVINFEAMNPLVDLYVVETFRMNGYCDVKLFNGLSPIKSVNGLEGIVKLFFKAKILFLKTYIIIIIKKVLFMVLVLFVPSYTYYSKTNFITSFLGFQIYQE